MPTYYFLHILTILEAFQATGGLPYYISDAKQSCTLASPPIIFNPTFDLVNIDYGLIHHRHSVLAEGQSYWIGYVKAYIALLYKGCASRVNSTVVYRTMKEDPGACFSRCQTDFIGLQASTCHCIKGVPAANQLLEDACSRPCTDQPGVLCGNNMYTSTAENNPGHCLAYNKRPYWTRCLPFSKPNSVCQKDDSAAPITFAPGTWSQAMQQCLKNATYPVSASNSYLPHTQGGLLWTGQIRSCSILYSRDLYHTVQYQQGYVVLLNGLFWLRFGQPQTTLFSICVNKTTPLPVYNSNSSQKTDSWPLHSYMYTTASNILSSSGKTSLTTYPTSRSLLTAGSTKTTNYNELLTSTTTYLSEYFFTRSTVPRNISRTSGNTADGNKSEVSKANGSNKVVIYTVIPLSLVVIIGVIIAILWRRRYLPFCKSVEEETTKSSVTTTTKLELQTRTTDSQNNEYVLEPMYLYEPMQENAAKNDSTETDYDTATPGGLKQNENSLESSNVYNKLDIMPTYSHIGGTVNFAMHRDDTYNHIEARSGENMYDSTNVSRSDRVNKYSDDTYSNVNKKI